MLVDEDRITIRVDHHEAGGAGGGLVGFGGQLDPLRFQSALKFADVGEGIELSSVAVPPWVEGQDVFVEHALKQADGVLTVL